jgi:hypothetical protein
VKPDLCVLPWAERFPESWRDVSSLVLAIEVLSLRTARADRHVKRCLYQGEGVAEYWIDLGSVFGPDDPDGLPERPRCSGFRPQRLEDALQRDGRDALVEREAMRAGMHDVQVVEREVLQRHAH